MKAKARELKNHTYMLKLPPALWRQIKIRAAEENTSARELIEKAVSEYLKSK